MIRGPLLAAATSLLRADSTPDELRDAVAALNSTPLPVLQRYFAQHQVGPLCHEAIGRLGLGPALVPAVGEWLLRASRLEIAHSLLRARDLTRIAGVLDDAGVTWFTFKGAHLAQILYATPYLRPCVDIDVLVAPEDRGRAARALLAAGMRQTDETPHEATYQELNGCCVDLHTSIIGQGRARSDLTQQLLARRIRLGGAWVPDDTATFVILTVHPALTDYVTGRLVRAVDLDRFLRLRQPDDKQATAIIKENGLTAAAWAMLAWTESWLHSPPTMISTSARPPYLQRRYLMTWLALDPNRVYLHAPNIARVGFSLFLHDHLADALRATTARTRV